MNKQLQDFARAELKTGLVELPEENHRTFKLMYASDNGKRSVVDAVAMQINDVVDEKLFRTDALPKDSLSMANLSWKEIFTDAVLQKHIAKALENNPDTRYKLGGYPLINGDINLAIATNTALKGMLEFLKEHAEELKKEA
jgi:hypothetical protein